MLIQLEEGIDAPRCANESRPASTVCQRRANDLAPYLTQLHVLGLIQHSAVVIQASHAVRVVRPEQLDLAPVLRELHPQLRLVALNPGDGCRVVLEVVPSYLLGLRVQWRYVAEPRALLLAEPAGLDEMIDEQHGLARSTMEHEHCEAVDLQRCVDLSLIGARRVRYDDILISHAGPSQRCTPRPRTRGPSPSTMRL